MAIKRRNRVSASFSMSSMTDLVFLLLIFFMITSTVVTPSAIKLLLPKSSSQAAAKPITRVFIDEQVNFYVATGKEKERQVEFEEIEPFLQGVVAEEQALNVVARKADGGMRDALSIFDQLVAFCGNNITYQQISTYSFCVYRFNNKR